MTCRMRLSVLLAALALGAFALGGCSSGDVDSDEVATEAVGHPQPMPTEMRDTLPEGFPLEVPAMDGQVVEVDTTDMDLGPWFYAMESPHERDAITSWYMQAYTGRSWQVADEASGATEHVLVLTKGAGAWSTVRVHTTDSGSLVECWTGIGVPMPPEALPPANAAASEV